MNSDEWKIKCVLIDFDGTLIDSLPILKSVYANFLKNHDLAGTEEEFNSLHGASILQIVTHLKTNHKLLYDLHEAEKQYRQLITENYGKAILFSNAKRTIINLKVWGFKVAIVSSAPRDLIEAAIGANQLLPLIDEIFTGSKFLNGKSNPEVYSQAIQHFQVTPEEAVAIEDSPRGLGSAISAGVHTIWIFPPKNPNIPAAISCHSWLEIETLAQVWRQSLLGPLTPVSPKLRIRLEREPEVRKVPPKVLNEIDKIWEEEQRKRKGKLFNGEIFSVTKWSKTTIHGEFVEYKWLMAQIVSSEIADILQLRPLAICGRTVAGEHVLLGKRSQSVTQSAGEIEFPPSGSIDSESCVDHEIDYVFQVKKELWEETGLDPNHIREVIPVSLQDNRQLGNLELFVDLILDPVAISSTIKKNGEYDWITWMKMD